MQTNVNEEKNWIVHDLLSLFFIFYIRIFHVFLISLSIVTSSHLRLPLFLCYLIFGSLCCLFGQQLEVFYSINECIWSANMCRWIVWMSSLLDFGTKCKDWFFVIFEDFFVWRLPIFLWFLLKFLVIKLIILSFSQCFVF